MKPTTSDNPFPKKNLKGNVSKRLIKKKIFFKRVSKCTFEISPVKPKKSWYLQKEKKRNIGKRHNHKLIERPRLVISKQGGK